ncbi:MAG: TetR/AcrR family transcriptional regulator [Parvibaculales bacterium]
MEKALAKSSASQKPTKGEKAVTSLMNAALSLLGANQSSELTPGLICQQAGMKRPSFYTYFNSVDELLDGLCAREVANLEAAYLSHHADTDSPLSRIVRIPLYIYARAQHERGWFQAVSHSVTWNREQRERRLTHLRADVRAAMASGQLKIGDGQIDGFIFLYMAAISLLVDSRNERAGADGPSTEALKLVFKGSGADMETVERLLGAPLEELQE